jgi:hypothetical protein
MEDKSRRFSQMRGRVKRFRVWGFRVGERETARPTWEGVDFEQEARRRLVGGEKSHPLTTR